MRQSSLHLWPRSQHKVAKYARSAEAKEMALIKEHPSLLALLALSFLFGFGFIFAAIYFIYIWLKKRAR